MTKKPITEAGDGRGRGNDHKRGLTGIPGVTTICTNGPKLSVENEARTPEEHRSNLRTGPQEFYGIVGLWKILPRLPERKIRLI